MMVTALRCIDDFRHAQRVLLGFVLPEFGIAYGFHTLRRSTRIASRIAFVPNHLQLGDDAAADALYPTNLPTRRTESATLAAPKSA